MRTKVFLTRCPCAGQDAFAPLQPWDEMMAEMLPPPSALQELQAEADEETKEIAQPPEPVHDQGVTPCENLGSGERFEEEEGVHEGVWGGGLAGPLPLQETLQESFPKPVGPETPNPEPINPETLTSTGVPGP